MRDSGISKSLGRSLGPPPLALSLPEFSAHSLVSASPGSFLLRPESRWDVCWSLRAGTTAASPLGGLQGKATHTEGNLLPQMSIPRQNHFCSFPQTFRELGVFCFCFLHFVQNVSVVTCGWDFFKGIYSSTDFCKLISCTRQPC